MLHPFIRHEAGEDQSKNMNKEDVTFHNYFLEENETILHIC